MTNLPPSFEVKVDAHSPVKPYRTQSGASKAAAAFAESLTEGMTTTPDHSMDFSLTLVIRVVRDLTVYEAHAFYVESDAKIRVVAKLGWLALKINEIVPTTRRYSKGFGVEFSLYLKDDRALRQSQNKKRRATR